MSELPDIVSELLRPERLQFTLVLLLFLPGFISLKVYDLIVPNEKRNFSHDFFEAVSYGTMSLILSVFLALLFRHFFHIFYVENFKILVFSGVTVVLLIAIILPIVFCVITKSNWWSKSKWFVSSEKTWDWVFSKRQSMWVIIYFNDGRRIGGFFGDNSYASSFPAKEQIYLEEVWNLDAHGEFTTKINQTHGIIIMGSDISSIAFFKQQNGKTGDE